jgi:hypothetical protein
MRFSLKFMRHRHSFSTLLFLFLCFISLARETTFAAPIAPSNLRVKPLGVNSFLMEWTDNSIDETGWDIRISLGAVPAHFIFVPAANLTSYIAFTNPLPGRKLTFQVAAYSGATGDEDISAPSSIVQVTALSPNRFDAPTDRHCRG